MQRGSPICVRRVYHLDLGFPFSFFSFTSVLFRVLLLLRCFSFFFFFLRGYFFLEVLGFFQMEVYGSIFVFHLVRAYGRIRASGFFLWSRFHELEVWVYLLRVS